MKKIILVLIAFLSVTSASAQETNILAPYNGGFENGMSNWRFFEVPNNIGSSAEITTTDVVEGSKAIKITFVSDDGTVVDRGFDNWNARVPVVAGSQYTAEVKAKTNETNQVYLNLTLGYFSVNGAVLEQKTERILLNNTYTKFSVTLDAPDEAYSSWIAFRLTDVLGERAEGTLFVDDTRMYGESTELLASVMETTLPSDDVVIASINVTDPPYNAVNDGSADVSSAFQAVIDRAVLAGGGVVFIPSGKYRFDSNILVREKVILRGEWQNPEETSNNVVGTILMPFAGQGSESAEAFIRLERGAGVKNLSIWYPNQTAPAVTPFSWTIQCSPDTQLGPGANPSIINITLVNSYQGIKIGPLQNELHYIRNVYGTPLKTGIWLSQTTDIGRIMNVHFEPKYWSQSGLTASPSEKSILDWLQGNATGIIMGRSDWEYIFDVSLIGYQTGMQIIRYSDFGPNGVIYGLNIHKSKIGIDLSDVNEIGFAITKSTINVEGENSVCVATRDGFFSIVQFNTCTFGGTPKSAIEFSTNSRGRLSFQNCTFENWGYVSTDAAIDCEAGSISLIDNNFKKEKLHIRLGDNANNSQILDNKFPTKLELDNKSKADIIISQEELDSKKLDVPPHPYAVEKRPATDDLFVVQNYGAIADGITDNTQSFIDALEAAKTNGGGTVYIPAGWYRLNGHITVPTGVELRGIWDTPHHTMSMGSVLLVYEGKNDESGIPFISLEEDAGVRGFTVWYPEQSTTDFFPYPWSIQTLGNNCWIKDVTLSNTWKGVDMASNSSSGHIINYLAGSPLKMGIDVSKNYAEGWIENVQFNPHYWLRSEGYPMESKPEFEPLMAFQQSQLYGFTIGDVKKEHILGTFIFAAQRGINITDVGECNADIFLHGTDAGINGVYMKAFSGEINFINTQLVMLGNELSGIIATNYLFNANASFYNTITWGLSIAPTAIIRGTGNILIQQLHTHNYYLMINSGKARIENVKIFDRSNAYFRVQPYIDDVKIFGSYSDDGFVMFNDNNMKIEADYNYGQSLSSSSGYKLNTGWEKNETENDWNNILWGNKNIVTNNNSLCKCVAEESANAHSGLNVLKIVGNKIEESDSLFFKVFKLNVVVFDSTTLSYWVNPQNESGRSTFVDLLFSDGSRLSELSPMASDGLPLASERGNIDEWVKVKCNIGEYAVGKKIQSLLVGTQSLTDGKFEALIDDLTITAPLLIEPWEQIDIGTQYLGGYSIFEDDKLIINSASKGLEPYEDKFAFVYQTINSECEISAKIESIQNPGVAEYVGVMIRESDSTISKFAGLFFSSVEYLGVHTKWRSSSDNVHSISHKSESIELPKWIKVSRKGNEFNTYSSVDGIAWGEPLYHIVMDMDSTVMIGLAAISGRTASWMETKFSNIVVSDKVVSVHNENNNLPDKFDLSQNYPNPFNPSTTIKYSIPVETLSRHAGSPKVTIKVYDILGREVATLVNKEQKPGNYEATFDARDLTSGIYYYRITAGDFIKTMKMILLK